MDTQTTQNETDDLSLILATSTDEELQEFLRLLHPADIADLVEQVEEESRKRIFSLIPDRIAADVLPEIDDQVFDEVMESVPPDKLADFVEEMDTDDAADFLAELPRYQRRGILARIDSSDSKEIRRLMQYGEDTAGGIMQTEMIAVLEDATVAETIEEIRERKEEVENVYFVFVVDSEKNLKGGLDVRDLLISDLDQRVSDIMETDIITTTPETDQEEVAALILKYNMVSVPVVDKGGKLIGRIWFDDVMDVIEDEVDEDFLLMAGAGEEELDELSVYKSVKGRLPWLGITWVGGIITAIIMGHYAETMENLIVLAAFIPIVMAMGGNVGTQSATIVVRGLATGRIDYNRISKFFLGQVAVGVILGVFIGLATGAFVRIHHSAMGLAFIIGVAMVAVMGFAAFIGTAMPAVFKRMGVDPAIATAPIISTFCDILGILIYLSLANLLMAWQA